MSTDAGDMDRFKYVPVWQGGGEMAFQKRLVSERRKSIDGMRMRHTLQVGGLSDWTMVRKKRREFGERGGAVDEFGSRFADLSVFVSPFKESFKEMSAS